MIGDEVEAVSAAAERVRASVARVIVGKEEAATLLLVALLCEGHVLIEDVPGVGKTTLAKALARSLDLSFQRIQFTPDLLPSDIAGVSYFNQKTQEFQFRPGPVFANLVLADEINRATPKTQSALLEAMQEHAVTIAGVRHAFDEPFFVLATENPIEMEGTYPLPEAQLDRFLLKVLVPTPGEDDLTEILGRTTGREGASPARVLTQREVVELRTLCRDVAVAEPVLRYAARLVGASSPENESATPLARRAVRLGAGVRGAQALVLAAKAVALLGGRGHIAFEDIARTARPVLRHRILRSFEGEADGITTDRIVDELVASVPMRPEVVQRAAQGQ
jgi:MoxR-like ATPase